MDRLYGWLLLSSIRGLGEASIKKLWLRYRRAEDILKASFEELEALIGTSKAKSIFERRLKFDPEQVLKVVEREGIGSLTLEDEKYPALLKEIEDPPPVLFYRGKPKDMPLVAVVGTRKPDIISLNYTKRLVSFLSEQGYAIVSGGAFGIDFQSHKVSLEHAGYTVCVLGMGILHVPSYLKGLPSEGVLFLSEFLPEARAEEYTFPRRNRLISGLSRAVVVVEAGIKSGALITADYAIRQGRPLWVFIGMGASNRWLGCVKLVNEGKAKLLAQPELLLESLPKAPAKGDPLLDLLSTPKTYDELLELSGMGREELNKRLFELQLEGRLTKNGAYYMLL